MTPTPPSSHALDRPAMRVLAHPLRSRLLAELRLHGHATATSLAASLGTNTGATSYHLRKLAEVGLVVDSGEGTGRRRVWRADSERRPPAQPDVADEDDAAALAWLERDYIQHFADKAQAWLDGQDDWPEQWRDACGLSDHTVQVTAEQLTAMNAELLEVLERYRRVGAGNPTAKRVSFYTCALPVDRPPRRG